MRPERAAKMANWLRTLAEKEAQTADVLVRLGERADPEPCRQKARLFLEVADALERAADRASEPVEPVSVPEAVVTPPEPETPPEAPEWPVRAPL